jgi:choline dehydrogenase
LAANLAVKGFRVCLIEAGGDPESYLYQVPCFHPFASEEPEMSWSYFVHHFSKNEERDWKYRSKHQGVFYPRAGTLGGCTAHNAMITIVPHDIDWEHIADVTGDESWRAKNMWPYFEKVENCHYRRQDDWPKPKGHGFSGWLHTNAVDPKMAFGDHKIIATVFDAWAKTIGKFEWLQRVLLRLVHFLITRDDPNDARNRATAEGMTVVPLATTKEGRRNSTREYIKKVWNEHRDTFDIRMNHLATRVLFDDDKRAVGVECWEGEHLYRADPNAAEKPSYVKREYRCTREVILAGGAFNTPQLLMLSGIGPKEHLQSKGIECVADRPAVGSNLQDRYEVSVVSTVTSDFELLKSATFSAPKPGEPGDACFQEWEKGSGVYTSNGTVAAIIKRSKSKNERAVPDLFIFGMPGRFEGYYPTYSTHLEDRKNYLTWAILKAHTENRGGTVRLRSKDPLDTPDINFHYFEEGTDRNGEDLQSVVEAVRYVRSMNESNGWIAEELKPGLEKVKTPEQIAEWVNQNAWGHHASCSCPMGKESDRDAVVDSRFRVIGTQGLRIVDASVFPRIPGLFIVTAIYMISEKAAEAIAEDAAQHT